MQSAPATSRSLGIPYSTLKWWETLGIIEPSTHAQGSGSQVIYSEESVRQARLAKTLLSLGLSRPLTRTATTLPVTGPVLLIQRRVPRYVTKREAAEAVRSGEPVILVRAS